MPEFRVRRDELAVCELTGTHLRVRPPARPLGFVDAASHRAKLARADNLYFSVKGEGDETELVMRPLFVTSVLLDPFMSELVSQ